MAKKRVSISDKSDSPWYARIVHSFWTHWGLGLFTGAMIALPLSRCAHGKEKVILQPSATQADSLEHRVQQKEDIQISRPTYGLKGIIPHDAYCSIDELGCSGRMCHGNGADALLGCDNFLKLWKHNDSQYDSEVEYWTSEKEKMQHAVRTQLTMQDYEKLMSDIRKGFEYEYAYDPKTNRAKLSVKGTGVHIQRSDEGSEVERDVAIPYDWSENYEIDAYGLVERVHGVVQARMKTNEPFGGEFDITTGGKRIDSTIPYTFPTKNNARYYCEEYARWIEAIVSSRKDF